MVMLKKMKALSLRLLNASGATQRSQRFDLSSVTQARTGLPRPVAGKLLGPAFEG